MPKLHLAPRKARAQQNCEAWWYENRAGIDVYIRTKDTGPTVCAHISKRMLATYMKRATP